MRVLGIDGGAERLGWGIVESTPTGPVYIDSGLVRMPRGASPFQDYRVTFIERYVKYLTAPGSVYDQEIVPIDAVVNETVPVVGSYGGTQMYLVNVAVTVVQALAIERDIPVHQVGATTVQKAMVGKRPKGKKITKTHFELPSSFFNRFEISFSLSICATILHHCILGLAKNEPIITSLFLTSFETPAPPPTITPSPICTLSATPTFPANIVPTPIFTLPASPT